jgi:glyoxylase-like metal-dependent hydrolase (beta-lactamase superfamily II)
MNNLSWQIGGARIVRVLDREAYLPLRNVVGDYDEQRLHEHRHWLAPNFLDDKDYYRLAVHALLIESCGKRIIVDTCIGEHVLPFDEAFAHTGRNFLDELAAAGFPRESIDYVMCTHMHYDHIGWNTMREGERWVPTFPNARYLFARAEWEYYSAHDDYEYMIVQQAVQPIIDAGLADLVETDHRLTAEVTLVPTPGHTPGHVSVSIQSGDARAFITGDMTHHPVQWAEPHWSCVSDKDRPTAEHTRRQVIEQLGNSNTLVIGTHFPTPCAGHITIGEEGTRFKF